MTVQATEGHQYISPTKRHNDICRPALIFPAEIGKNVFLRRLKLFFFLLNIINLFNEEGRQR